MTGCAFIYQRLSNLLNLGVNFHAPKNGYQFQKRPVLSPAAGSV